MPLAAGSRLGPYEVLAPLGAGGMGEVYRARDPRLGRDVAIKVLPASFSSDADRLKRFEQEARAAGRLNHPNITIVYDIGQHEGAPYVVQELLDGETLRAELASGRLSARKAVDYAVEIARGLAAAHEKGIVHRDLKPENLFVTRDGRVKILDFGLAKLTQAEGSASATNLPTATEPGVVMGTLGYMSPEQVKAKPADARSDIFALGAILYEMISGQRAFRGDSAGETMAAILKEDPPELSLSNKNVSPGLERILRHCLEKNSERRFQSASDLAFDLEALSGTSGSVAAGARAPVQRRRFLSPGIALLALAAGLAAGALWLRRGSPTAPTFTQLTFRRGTIGSARFGPDGESVIFSASWDGQPDRIYTLRPGSPEWSALDLPPLQLLSVSRSGELAVWVPPVRSGPSLRGPMLARVPLAGGSPRDILEDVEEADWAPDGNNLAVTHIVDGRAQLEFPIGTVLYRSSDRVEGPRVSPRGDRVAFRDHPLADETIGSVMVADQPGTARVLSDGWFDLQSLAWRPDGGEIWFSASRAGSRDSLWAVDLSGKLRLVAAAPGSLLIQDVSAAGKALVLSQSYRDSLSGILPGETRARDFSWLDFSHARDLSDDGTTLLFQEWGEGGGAKGGVYLRRVSDASPIRLGDGFGLSLSPDGRRVLARLYTDPPRLVLLPTGAGQPEDVPLEGLVVHTGAWFPDGKRLLILASKGTEWAFWVLELPGGAVRKLAVTRNPTANRAMMRSLISPDGRLLARMDDDRRPSLLSLESGESRPALGFEPLENPIGWTPDGKSLFVIRRDRMNIVVTRVDPFSGNREKWREVETSADPVGLRPGGPVLISADGRTIFWSAQRFLDELYLVDGLK